MSMKLITLSNLSKFAELSKGKFATQADLSSTEAKAADAIKYASVSGNTISLFKTADGTGTAAFTIDFPTEYFLDQAHTTFVQSFAWSSTLYPGTTNPNLDGKPVMVLAVKDAEGESVQYSFVDLTYLLNTYTGVAGDGTATVTVDGYNIKANVNVSAVSGNTLVKKTDGLYVAETDISGKADKDTDAVTGNLAKFDANGNPIDAGKKTTDFVEKVEGKGLSSNDYTDAEKTKLAGIETGAEVNKIAVVKVDGTALDITSKAVDIDLSGKVDKITGKGLSTEDYTTTEKTKLAGIAEGAQVNVLETIKVDGTALTITSKAVDIDLSGKVDKVTGKGLSTEDYSTAEKTKLTGIAEGATKVESSSTNGKIKINGVDTVVYELPGDVIVDADIETVTDAEIAALFDDEEE